MKKGQRVTLRYFGRVRVLRANDNFVFLIGRAGRFVLRQDFALGLVTSPKIFGGGA